MKLKDKIILNIAIIAIFIWLVYMVKSILTPFVFSLIIAYFLDPMVDRLESSSKKISRIGATTIILGFSLMVLVVVGSVLLPVIYSQLDGLLRTIPKYFQIFANDFYPQIIESASKAGIKLESDLAHVASNEEFTAKFVNFSQDIFSNALNSSMSLINVLSLIFITPILVFYLLKDWDILVKKINDYLPKNMSSEIQHVAEEIDKTLSGYIRGQFNVCVVLAILYSTALSMSGLNFGFLIGLLTGLLAFIPYVGMMSGVLTAIIVALFQWGLDFHQIGIIALIFAVGQILEGNFLTPKLIGEKIGLHPVWLIFGLFVFGSLFGIMGVLIAVPLTAIFGVVIKYFAMKYKKKFA